MPLEDLVQHDAGDEAAPSPTPSIVTGAVIGAAGPALYIIMPALSSGSATEQPSVVSPLA